MALKELSKDSQWYITQDRYLELLHFCHQYPQWTKDYYAWMDAHKDLRKNVVEFHRKHITVEPDHLFYEPLLLLQKITIVDETAFTTNRELVKWLRMGIIHGRTYDQMAAEETLPVSRAEYYDNYRKFFWMLSRVR